MKKKLSAANGMWALLSVLICVLLLRYHATAPKPLILTGVIAIVGILRILRIRNSYQGNLKFWMNRREPIWANCFLS